MENNYRETFSLTSFLSPMAGESFISGLMNDSWHDDGIQRFQGHNMLQIEPTGHNTEQCSVSGSGLPLPIGDIRFGEQGSGLPQANMVGTDVNAAVTGRPGQKRNDPFSDTGIQQPLHYEIPQIGPTGHNTEQDSGLSQANMVGTDVTAAVTGRPGQKRNVTGHDNGIQRFQGHNMLQIKPTGHKTEQGSGSGLPQVNMVETEATAAVPGRPGQKRIREINSAERSKNYRDNKKEKVREMEEMLERAQEEKKMLQKDNERLNTNLNVSNGKLNDQREKIHWLSERLAEYKKACDKLQIQTNSFSQTLVKMSSLREENRRLQADKDLLMQQVNDGTNAKKWVKIPLEDRKLKIKGNVLFLKMA